MAAPTFRGSGAPSGNAAAIAPALPSGVVAGDLLIMWLETADQAITVSGWTEVPTVSPQSVAGATRLTVFTKVAVGGDATTTSDSGDHQFGFVHAIQTGTYNPLAPINAATGTTRNPAGTTATIPGPTTTVDECLIIACSGHGNDTNSGQFTSASWANANLVSIAEVNNGSTNQGNGGGGAAAVGVKATAGAVGNTTVTVISSVGGMIAIAIAPAIPKPPPSLLMAPRMA